MSMKKNHRGKVYCFLIFIIIFFSGCADSPQHAKEKQPAMPAIKTKPGAVTKDSLNVSSIAAVFYEPDSVQLENIKAANDKNIFDATMHEYASQVRNAKAFLEEHWPNVKIIAAKNVRYLRFIKANGQIEVVDLDTKNDAIGLFLFDPRKSPMLVDMMSIDDQVPNYFSK